MKIKKLFVFLILFLACQIPVSARVCNLPSGASAFTYYAADYADEPYCEDFKPGCSSNGGRNNLCSSGCFTLTFASILRSYGNDVEPRGIAKYLCASSVKGFVQRREYSGNVTTNADFLNQYNMEVVRLENSIAAIDAALANKKMVLASVNSKSIFTGNTHYIAIVTRRENGDYFVINTSTRDDQARNSNWYSRESILVNIMGAINAGLWSVIPRDCTSFASTTGINGSGGSGSTSNPGSGEASGGSTTDPYPNVFPDLNADPETECNALFMDRRGNLNELGEFVNDLFFLIKIAAPTLVLILSTLDYVKAIASSNADEVKKATQRTIKRAIIGLIIFFLPFLLDLLFELFGLYDISKCQIVS